MREKQSYLWKRNSDDILQCVPKGSSLFFLQPQGENSFFQKMKNSKTFFKPQGLLYDPLSAREISNSGIIDVQKNFYQERENAAFCHIGFVFDGKLTFKTDEYEFKLSKGMFFCTKPFEHYILKTDSNWFGFWVHFRITPFIQMRMKHGCIVGQSSTISELEFVSKKYLQELRSSEITYELLDAYAELVEVLLRRDLSEVSNKAFSLLISKVKRDPAMFDSTDSAAQSIGISRYELDKLCIKELGMSFAKYNLAVKMSLARKYSSRMCSPISIAKAIGFSDAASFSKAFKAYHNITFEDFRKVSRYRDENDFL